LTTFQNDLTIDELLGDPITHAIMKADRVDPLQFEAMLRALQLWAARAAGRPEDDIRSAERTPFACNAGGRFLSSRGPGQSESSRRVAPRSSIRSILCGAQ
jgi:hypothetical protein